MKDLEMRRSSWISCVRLHPMTRVPEGRHREEKTPGEEEAALRRQAETGVMQPPAKACRGHQELGAAGRTHQPSEGA